MVMVFTRFQLPDCQNQRGPLGWPSWHLYQAASGEWHHQVGIAGNNHSPVYLSLVWLGSRITLENNLHFIF